MRFGYKNPLTTVKEIAQGATETVNSIITGATSATNNAASTTSSGYAGVQSQWAKIMARLKLQMEAAAKDPASYVDKTKDSIVENVTSVAADNNVEKPGGTIKKFTDLVNPSNSVEDQAGAIANAANTVFDPNSSIYDEDTNEDDTENNTKDNTLLTAGLNDPGSEENEDLSSGNTKKRTANFSRNQSNLTVNANSSLLT